MAMAFRKALRRRDGFRSRPIGSPRKIVNPAMAPRTRTSLSDMFFRTPQSFRPVRCTLLRTTELDNPFEEIATQPGGLNEPETKRSSA